jgi:hypothetical protein
MSATHTHSPAAEMGSAATHTHGTAANMNSASTPTEVGTATATTEVTAAAAATTADMSTTAPTRETAAASRVSNSRQAKGKAYCGRARCDFPHDTTSSTPNSPPRSGRTEAGDAAMHTVVHFTHQLTCG